MLTVELDEIEKEREMGGRKRGEESGRGMEREERAREREEGEKRVRERERGLLYHNGT